MGMKTSENGRDLIKSYEKLRLTAYMPTPKDRPTIGWGHTKGVKLGDKITREQAEQFFSEDLSRFEECINQAVTVALNENQFDALAAFVFNVGPTAFVTSTMLKKLNEKDYVGAAGQFKRWNKQAGEVVAGLTRRREEERQLFVRTPLH